MDQEYSVVNSKRNEEYKMNKQVKRQVMNAISQMNLSDEGVQGFIRNLVQKQQYKTSRPRKQFCTDCAIFYTSSVYTMARWRVESEEDYYYKWSEKFIEECEDL
ncbi:hypothetical protein VPBG_00007 [Vibrio phage helene 12B3]|uniref:hypothetical protein n=1 Tax=Vibrio phage helene 12B3 TaxID=573173 RepID=UPI0002C13FB8|nr:hypothetical protein VPBG_00007 [Vibrio phage helene 12B3]AGG57780.1 hypothetical protein VPBG_00007 [Vibrio phage helene 12B3]